MVRRRKGKLSLISGDIQPVVKQIGARQRNVHPEIWARWIEILGPNLATRAVPYSWQRGRLCMAVASSTWMQELTYLKPVLLEKFEAVLGSGVVKDIRLKLDPTIPRKSLATTDGPTKESVPRSGLDKLPENLSKMIDDIEDESLKRVVEKALRASFRT